MKKIRRIALFILISSIILTPTQSMAFTVPAEIKQKADELQLDA